MREELHDGAEVALLKFSDLDYLSIDATRRYRGRELAGRCAHEGHVRRAPFMPKSARKALTQPCGPKSPYQPQHQHSSSFARLQPKQRKTAGVPCGGRGRMFESCRAHGGPVHSQPRSTSTRPRTARRSPGAAERPRRTVRPLALVDLPARELPQPRFLGASRPSGAGAGDLPACNARACPRSDGRVARLEPWQAR